MFTTDSRTENYLTHEGVKFEYEDSLPFNGLHPDWKQNNMGRNQPIDPDAVLDYAIRMEAKSPAPAVIVVPGNGGYLVLDGVQRLCAAESYGATSFAAYALSQRTSLRKQHLIRVCSNSGINGSHTPPQNWIIQQAVEVLVVGDNMSPEEVARAIGRPASKIRDELRFQKTSQLFQRVGYEGPLTTKKWFCNEVGLKADQTDFDLAPEVINKWLRLMEKCSFKNGGATTAIDAFFEVTRKAKKDRFVQLQTSLKKVQDLPEVRQKLTGKKRATHLESLLPAMRAVDKIAEQAIAKNEIVHDGPFAEQLAECWRYVNVKLKSLVPQDLQYLNNRRRSIFDKG